MKRIFKIKKVDVRANLKGEILILLLFLGTIAVARILTPKDIGIGTHTELGLPPCTFYKITKLPCPGCGLTTSFSHMARLHVAKAFKVHPFGPPLFLAVLLLLIRQCILLMTGNAIYLNISVRAETIIGITLLIIFIIYAIVRGVYYYLYVLHGNVIR